MGQRAARGQQKTNYRAMNQVLEIWAEEHGRRNCSEKCILRQVYKVGTEHTCATPLLRILRQEDGPKPKAKLVYTTRSRTTMSSMAEKAFPSPSLP